MGKDKQELIRRTTESFVKKSEIEKAFILGYMVKRMQIKELEADLTKESELVVKQREVREMSLEKWLDEIIRNRGINLSEMTRLIEALICFTLI